MRQASRAPHADHAVAVGGQAGGRNFNRDARDIPLADQLLVILALGNSARERRAIAINRVIITFNRDEVDKIKDRAEIDREIFGALAGEDPASRRAAGNRNIIDELVGISRIARNRLVASIVERLGESHAAATGIGHCRNSALTPIAGNLVHGEGLTLAKVGIVVHADLTGMSQRDRQCLAPDGDRIAGAVAKLVAEFELEGRVFLGVAVGIDHDLVQSVGIHRVIIRTVTGALIGLEICDQRGEARAARLVAAESISVGVVDLGHLGDVGRFAMA